MTSTEGQVELLDNTTNRAVVRVPGRRFPGVVVQGDSLGRLVHDLERAAQSDSGDELAMVLTEFRELQTHYESVLRCHGIDMP
ncbi:MAG: hypothetical protein AAFR96_09580 [Planctomycetota bacterium]